MADGWTTDYETDDWPDGRVLTEDEDDLLDAAITQLAYERTGADAFISIHEYRQRRGIDGE